MRISKAANFAIILSIIVLSGLILRLVISFELLKYDTNVLNPSPLADMAVYRKLADLFVYGEFNGPFKFHPFYYTVFLPLISLCPGTYIYNVLVSQSFLGPSLFIKHIK